MLSRYPGSKHLFAWWYETQIEYNIMLLTPPPPPPPPPPISYLHIDYIQKCFVQTVFASFVIPIFVTATQVGGCTLIRRGDLRFFCPVGNQFRRESPTYLADIYSLNWFKSSPCCHTRNGISFIGIAIAHPSNVYRRGLHHSVFICFHCMQFNSRDPAARSRPRVRSGNM